MFSKKTGASDKTSGSKAKSDAAPGEAKAKRAVSEEEAKKKVIAAKQTAAAFGEIVTVLMRSPTDRKRSIADLEWMVVPAVARGQFMIAEAQSKETGAVGPVGFILWALVSPEVDKRLSDAAVPPNLSPAEWRSGDIPWVIAGVGDQNVLNGLLQQLTKSVYKDREVKMRVQGADGKIATGRLSLAEKPR